MASKGDIQAFREILLKYQRESEAIVRGDDRSATAAQEFQKRFRPFYNRDEFERILPTTNGTPECRRWVADPLCNDIDYVPLVRFAM